MTPKYGASHRATWGWSVMDAIYLKTRRLWAILPNLLPTFITSITIIMSGNSINNAELDNSARAVFKEGSWVDDGARISD